MVKIQPYCTGYGGFNLPQTPGSFKVERMVFMENGGVFAMANILGGSEYGEKWHEAGTKLQKQNVFNDFIAAAEFLISEKYTSPEKLGINGRSNGGLLVGAVMTQRPDLFKSCHSYGWSDGYAPLSHLYNRLGMEGWLWFQWRWSQF